ncbi:envelope stress response protein PspG [Vibrio cholerae]|jgi:phage shock protein G|uniref:Envelope stress response protein PspG n=1 Tax=Vibrio tarriae TaxID=2014742 RepID=A0AAU8WKE0_9VIBR|nr:MULTISPECIES: envelope stress response protein PspG [Vibrio]ASK56389.1 envelope stress response protein PspG [Vibrio tarriae]EGQ8325053.1 envelope stress response protein PspG [Vibrio cholerae]EGQ9418006.1 envelope stress response protein PspG [Vibrio cholerae]EGQ9730714.1 envelope stress response protein PspG [Vibrio cholerae]EGR0582212.1 envelope stress response protein PspG [Vibrio cholerae]
MMFELIFIFVFAATLLVTGITLMSVFGAMALAFLIMALFGMLGIVLKLLPWLLVVLVVIWLMRDKAKASR